MFPKTDRLAKSGVQVILNYTPVDLRSPSGVTIHTADPVQDLLRTLYHLSHSEQVPQAR